MTSDPTAMTSSPTPRSTPDFATPTALDLTLVTGGDSVLIALDFDGVLAPLQDNPDRSRMLPESAQAIADLSGLPGTRVALVSGRDLTTLRRLAEPPQGVWLVGSHGAEVDLGEASPAPSVSGPPESPSSARGLSSGPDATSSAPGPTSSHGPSSSPGVTTSPPEVSDEEQRMLTAIDAHIESFEHDLTAGSAPATEARVERKPFSRTVHTRGLDPEFASALHAHVIAVQAEHPGIRVIEGHDITELAVKTATKGDGLRALIAAGSPSAVLYLGDDVTDEDAFAELEASTTSLGIKVGPAPTRAPWRITDPDAVAELLTRIATERRAHLV